MCARDMTDYQIESSYLNGVARQLGYSCLEQFISFNELWMAEWRDIDEMLHEEIRHKNYCR